MLSRTREPDGKEFVLVSLEKQRAIYKKDPAAAKKVVHSGESRPRRRPPRTPKSQRGR
ncbi:MAG: hypothetical protein U0791_01030 [Gemmataceae bacterium]